MTLPMAYPAETGNKNGKKTLFAVLVGVVIGIILYFSLNTTHVVAVENAISNALIVQHTTYVASDVAPSIEDKMVSYMQKVNPTLDEGLAYRLAAGIMEQYEKYKLPIDLQMGLIQVESHYQQYALSETGAVGFYQILPRWHIDKINRLYKTGVVESKNLYTAKMQSELGGEILYTCLKKHRNNTKKALLCYNGSQHDETAEYANRVLEAKKEVAEFI